MSENKKIRDFIEPYNFVACPKETPILKALELAKTQSDSMQPILIKEEDEVIGIFTQTDLFALVVKKVDLTTIMIQEVMTQSPYFLESNADIDTCIHLMLTHRFRHIPIKNQKGRIYAVADVFDILKAIIQEIKEIKPIIPAMEI